MKVFISSVRQGLEEERDSLPGLILAAGHEPTRFEDYTARSVPSRQACLEGVQSADVYLLLLGEKYGTRMPDTGKSPTEEEFTVAQRQGIPILAFVKKTAQRDRDQAAFIERIEDYTVGRFRRSFSTTPELLAEVVRALKDVQLGKRQAPTPLMETLTVDWMVASGPLARHRVTHRPILEVHVISLGTVPRIKVLEMDQLGNSVARAARDSGLIPVATALEVSNDGDVVTVAVRDRAIEAGLRVTRDRAVAVWEMLASDTLGAIIDPVDLDTRIEKLLRVALETQVLDGEVALAAAIGPLDFTQEGSIGDLGRRSTAAIPLQPEPYARAEPEEIVSREALFFDRDELVTELRARLMHAYRRGVRT